MKLYLKSNRLFNEDIRMNNREERINTHYWDIESQNAKRILISGDKRKHRWIDMDLDHKGYCQKPRGLK